jgi:hypothetical protein
MDEKSIKQNTLFGKKEWWEEHWQDMPEYESKDLTSFSCIIVHFSNLEDLKCFAKLINQPISSKTQSIWFPQAKIRSFKNKCYVTKGYKNEP